MYIIALHTLDNCTTHTLKIVMYVCSSYSTMIYISCLVQCSWLLPCSAQLANQSRQLGWLVLLPHSPLPSRPPGQKSTFQPRQSQVIKNKEVFFFNKCTPKTFLNIISHLTYLFFFNPNHTFDAFKLQKSLVINYKVVYSHIKNILNLNPNSHTTH